MTHRFPWTDFTLVLALAAVGRALLLLTGTVSFHSDEAIVALMARHSLQGQIPTFFYGQDYMGSLNALTAAAGFAVFGERVVSIRIVQFGVYLVVTATSYWAAWHLSHRRVVALAGGLVVAACPPLVVIYTATNIGSYAETMIFGNLLLILGYDLSQTHRESWLHWGLLGLTAGVAWWGHGLMIAYALPVGLLLLWTLFRGTEKKGRYGLGLVVAISTFFVGSLPWWLYNLRNDWAALAVYMPGGGFESTLLERLIGLVALGIPAIVGMRYTWLEYYLVPIGVVALLIYITAIYQLSRTAAPATRPGARPLVLGVPLALTAVFLLSSFGADPTGRYLLPFIVPFGVALGAFAEALRLQRGLLWVAPLAFVALYNYSGQLTAVVKGDPGFTTQFNLETHAPNTYDSELIDWLLANDLRYGHTNYWIGYRLAFLSNEQLQYSTQLSYRPDEIVTDVTERYPAYAEATATADRIAYITWTNLPDQGVALSDAFTERGLTFQEIGRAHV
jgi:hypothetical protein